MNNDKEASKKIIFAHMVNTIRAANFALNLGVNGLEMDIRFNPETNKPSEFRHSSFTLMDLCDCSLSTYKTKSICNYNTCISSENVILMLNFLATRDTLAVLYIDSKIYQNDKPKNMAEAGKNVIELLEEELFLHGYKGQVIVSAKNLKYAKYIMAAVKASMTTKNKEKYFFTYDADSK